MIATTLVLDAGAVARCLEPAACRDAIERAFADRAAGRAAPPRALGFESERGTFHIKAARGASRFVAKLNGNFPGNPHRHGLPTIQGVVVLCDALDGRPLAILDSGSLTAIRTAAASAVAATHLARPGGPVAIVGCGVQGAAHVEALLALAPAAELRLFDVDRERARRLAAAHAARSSVAVRVAASVREATLGAAIVATCTPGAGFVLDRDDVSPGALVAAVGTDNPYKREIHPDLMKRARVVVDDLAQCAAGGDLHHALAAGAMRESEVQATLAEVVSGARAGREREDDLVVFDSTGVAIEDLAAAGLAFDRAAGEGAGIAVAFAGAR